MLITNSHMYMVRTNNTRVTGLRLIWENCSNVISYLTSSSIPPFLEVMAPPQEWYACGQGDSYRSPLSLDGNLISALVYADYLSLFDSSEHELQNSVSHLKP